MPSLNTGNAILSNAITVNSIYNVGIGTTNQFLSTGVTAVEFGSVGFLYGSSNNSAFGNNAYLNGSGSWLYKTTNPASLMGTDGGTFNFQTASSGSANASLTWSTKMFLSNSGFLGIGTTSPSYALDVQVNNSSFVSRIINLNTTTDNAGLLVQAGVTAGNEIALFRNAAGTARMGIYANGNIGIGTTSPNGGGFASTTVTINSPNASYATIELGKATASTSANLGVLSFYNGTNYDICNIIGVSEGANNSGALRFNTVNAGSFGERMRVNSAGHLLIGTTSDNAYGSVLYAVQANSTWASVIENTTSGAKVYMSHGGNYGMAINSGSSTGSTYALSVGNNSAEFLKVRGDGYLFSQPTYNLTTASAANVNVQTDGTFCRSTSSLKYKTDVREYDKGLAEVMAMRPVYYKGIGELDGNRQFAGLIAEEIDTLGLTEFVQYAEDGSPDALAYQNMVALLVKAIQQQQQQINQLINK